MARKEREAIAIVLDIGHSVSQDKDKHGVSYMDKARSCASMVVQRKLFGKSNDLVSLVLLGSKDTDNTLGYPNIEVLFQMSPATWEMLEFLEKRVKPTRINADWLDAIVMAMQFIKDELDGSTYKITSKKLIVFTNFSTPVSEDQVDTIINGFKNLQIELIIIGPDIVADVEGSSAERSSTNGSQSSKTEHQITGEALISKIVTEVGGVICSFEDAIPQLQYFETKKIKPAPWNVVMDIGPDIHIAVTGYKKIANVALPTWKTEQASAGTGIESERSYFKQDVEQKAVSKEELIDGYKFGSTIVPFSAIDQSQLQYQSGPRCLSVIGTTVVSNIPRHLLVGDGCYCIVPQKDDPAAAVALSALIRGLHDKKMVAIARRVYNNNNAPVLSVLFPKVRLDYECLVLVDLPFSEDMRYFKFPSLKNVKPSEEQVKCIDNLIDNMDLMTAIKHPDDEPSEAFHPKHNLNPYHQHFYQKLCDRGLNPDSPLKPVGQITLELLETPFKNEPKVINAINEVKKCFSLTVLKQKEQRRKAEDIFKKDESMLSEPANAPSTSAGPKTMAEITEQATEQIGTVHPVQDFKKLLEKGHPFRNIANEMGGIITNLVLHSFGSDDYEKAMSALRSLRETCLCKETPDIFNKWLVGFKEKILSRGKRPFWELAAKENLGQISTLESTASDIDPETAAKFLSISEITPKEEDINQFMDVEDLLDEI